MNTTHRARRRSAVTAALLGTTLAIAAAAPASAAGYSYIATANGAFYIYACESGNTMKIKVVPVSTNNAFEYRVKETASGSGTAYSAWTNHSTASPAYVALATTVTASSVTVTVTDREDGATRAGGVSDPVVVRKSIAPNC